MNKLMPMLSTLRLVKFPISVGIVQLKELYLKSNISRLEEWKISVGSAPLNLLFTNSNVERLAKSAQAGINHNPKSHRVPELEKVKSILNNHHESGTNPLAR